MSDNMDMPRDEAVDEAADLLMLRMATLKVGQTLQWQGVLASSVGRFVTRRGSQVVVEVEGTGTLAIITSTAIVWPEPPKAAAGYTYRRKDNWNAYRHGHHDGRLWSNDYREARLIPMSDNWERE